MTVTVRQATEDDVRAIAAVEALASDAPWGDTIILGVLDEEASVVLVSLDHTGRVTGHVLALIAADEGEILSLAVHPEARRKGHARALLAALVEVWTARDVATAWLEVRRDNAGAQALYAATGWEPSGVRRAYYSDGTDALVLRRVLRPL